MTDTITLPRSVVEQALKLWDAQSIDENYDYGGAFLLWGEHARPEDLALQFRAALEQPDTGNPVSVPEGWKLVPSALTDAQRQAAQDTWWNACNGEMYWEKIYAAMLAAEPQPPAGEKTQPEIDHAHELRRHSRKLGEPVGETAGVMQRAADEIERLCAMLAAASQPKLYPLPDDLYGGSKDWRAGSYAERVEWLHLMYEGVKEEIERLGQPQVEQEPFTILVRKRSWVDNLWDAAPRGFPDYGKEWADERINVYTHPQPKRDPLSDEQILKLGWAVTPYANQMEMLSIARAIERAHGIGDEV